MTDLRVRISAPTYNGHPSLERTFTGIDDANPGQLTVEEARRALAVLNRFHASNHGIADQYIQIEIGTVQSTIPELRRITGIETTILRSRVSPHGFSSRFSFAPSTLRGLEGAMLYSSSIFLSYQNRIEQGSVGSLTLNAGLGAFWNQGDGALLANNGGPIFFSGIEAKRNFNNVISLLFAGNVFVSALFGRSQIPERADWTRIDQHFGLGAQGCLGLRGYLSEGTTIDACWAPTISWTPNGVRDVGGTTRDLLATSLLGFSLGMTYHPVATVVEPRDVTICEDTGHTLESARSHLQNLSAQIQELRFNNTELRQQVLQRYPSLDFNGINGLSIIPEFSPNETTEVFRVTRECQELDNLLTIYERRRNDLLEQNSRLQRIQDGREELTLPVRTDTQRLRSLGISIDGRFEARHVALILQNREYIDRLSRERNPIFNDVRPIAVVIEAIADYNGAFQSQAAKPINVFAEDVRFFTLYYQASNTSEIRDALVALRRVTGRSVHTLVIAGHGNRRSLQLGSDASQNLQLLDSRDVINGDLNYLRDVMDLNEGELVLHACSNGGVRGPDDRDPTHSLASEIYDRIEGINVLSMDRPGNISAFRVRENLMVEIQWSNARPSFMYRHHLPPGFLNPNSTAPHVSRSRNP